MAPRLRWQPYAARNAPPQPYPNAAFGLAFARGLWRPPQHYYAQVYYNLLESVVERSTICGRLSTAAFASAGLETPFAAGTRDRRWRRQP